MIFYFTGSGNSLYIASKVAEATDDYIVDIALALKNNKFDYKVKTDEKVGFVFPTYFFGVPSIVEEFAKEVTFDNKEGYFYSLITCGSMIGRADSMFAKILINKAIKINASYQIEMPDNYIFMYDVSSDEFNSSKIAAADVKLKEIVSSIKNKELVDCNHSFINYVTSKMLYQFYRGGMSTKKFHVDNKCIGCGQCAKNCPCQAIEMKNGVPVWTKNKCTRCLACIHRCPVKAIQYGKGTVKRGRYVNPILK